MATPGTKAPPLGARNAVLSVVVALTALAALAYVWPKPRASDPVVLPSEHGGVADLPPPPLAEAVRPADPAAPSFDVVRIGPRGDAVIAGRAAPGAEVIVRDGETEVARVLADRQGNFVAIPTAPFAPGGRELTLASRGVGGGERAGQGSVILDVPHPPSASVAARPPATVVLVPDAAAPRVLQGAAHPGSGPTRFTLDVVDYDDAGSIRFTGGSPAGGTLRLYIDNAAVGDARADAGGRWSLTPARPVAPGLHTVRVDQLDRAGKVLSRLELPFQRAALQAADLAGGTVVVQPGQNLWRIAKLAYGRGMQYRVIYLANREQIRDPQRIYPGQTFAVPPT